MVVPGYERHGVYHIATRGGHEVSLVVIDDDVGGSFEGFRCDVHDHPPKHKRPGKKPENHNAHVVVADECVTVEPDAVDFSVFFGAIRSDGFETVEFPDVEEDHSTRYANLADAYGYEPDVGEREDDEDRRDEGGSDE